MNAVPSQKVLRRLHYPTSCRINVCRAMPAWRSTAVRSSLTSAGSASRVPRRTTVTWRPPRTSSRRSRATPRPPGSRTSLVSRTAVRCRAATTSAPSSRRSRHHSREDISCLDLAVPTPGLKDARSTEQRMRIAREGIELRHCHPEFLFASEAISQDCLRDILERDTGEELDPTYQCSGLNQLHLHVFEPCLSQQARKAWAYVWI